MNSFQLKGRRRLTHSVWRHTLVAVVIVSVVLGMHVVTSAAAPAPTKAEPPTQPSRLEWHRAGVGAPVKVVGKLTSPRHEGAHDRLDAVAARLDSLRTLTPHVVWTRLAWIDGRYEVDAEADAAIYANVAMMATRDLFPKYSTAGSGIRPLRSARTSYGWKLSMKISPRRPARRAGRVRSPTPATPSHPVKPAVAPQ